jgi:hypothetical protein
MANLATKQIFFNKIAKPYTAIKCFANADLGVWRVWGLSLKALQNEFK